MSRAAMPIGPDPLPALGVPWADGQVTLRLRGPGKEPGRILRTEGPVALIGRHPGASIRIADRAAAPRHALLVLDRRGLFCVDLLTRSGTRFAGREIASQWLIPGDALEIAGRRLEVLRLRADGAAIDPSPVYDDLFAPAGPDLERLSLHPLDGGHAPWVLGSPLAFLGRSAACGIRLLGSAASPIHCAIWREPDSARVIDLLGRDTRVNGQPVVGSAPLRDGDILRIGRAEFRVGIGTQVVALPVVPAVLREIVPVIEAEPIEALTAHPAVREPEAGLNEILDLLRQFQGDAATLIEGQFAQIDALRRELAALREDLIPPPALPAESARPFDLEIPATPAAPTSATDNAAWLLGRLNALEPETRSRWKDMLGRITTALSPRASSDVESDPPTTDLVPPKPTPNDPS
ncbi:FHA domain-containing protein (plasmid) [Tundrisphaera sp. TA3]|uniref:FHA domain-containing protein n=1 Tax=Tundrisphaera sp. TA3 TaxID=3435775 RepID=UPI003EB7AC99